MNDIDITSWISRIPVETSMPTGPSLNGHSAPEFPDGEEPEPSSYLSLLPAIYSGDRFVGRFLRIFEDVLGPISDMVDNQPYYFDPMTAPTRGEGADGRGAYGGVGPDPRGAFTGQGTDGHGGHVAYDGAAPDPRSALGGGAAQNGISSLATYDSLMEVPDLLDWMGVWVDLAEGENWPLDRRRALVAAAPSLYRMRGTSGGIMRHLAIYTGGMVLIEERTNGFRLAKDTRVGINTSIGENRPGIFTVTIAVSRPDELDINTIRAIIEADKPVETAYILRVVQIEGISDAKKARKTTG